MQNWPGLEEALAGAMARPPAACIATRHGGGIDTATKPQKFTCDDNRLYAVKFIQNEHGDGKGAFNEQVIGTIGALIGAPVAPVELVRVPQQLIDELNLDRAAHFLNFTPVAGLHHGSRWQDNCSGRQNLAHVETNRERFGALDVLHAWTGCSGDQQWIYDNDPPHAVFSTDHTTFFPEGFAWNATTIATQHGTAAPDPALAPAGLTNADRAGAVRRLAAVTSDDIVAAVGRPPADWGVSKDERLALAIFLLERKDPVITLYS